MAEGLGRDLEHLDPGGASDRDRAVAGPRIDHEDLVGLLAATASSTSSQVARPVLDGDHDRRPAHGDSRRTSRRTASSRPPRAVVPVPDACGTRRARSRTAHGASSRPDRGAGGRASRPASAPRRPPRWPTPAARRARPRVARPAPAGAPPRRCRRPRVRLLGAHRFSAIRGASRLNSHTPRTNTIDDQPSGTRILIPPPIASMRGWRARVDERLVHLHRIIPSGLDTTTCWSRCWDGASLESGQMIGVA